jgi:NhaA family Na+:H+ antiporter
VDQRRAHGDLILPIDLELKREVPEGQLASREPLILPVIGAVGGFFVPAAIYVAINWGNSSALNGWAIPSATDIAFALGVLTLLGDRVPLFLKVFLTSLAEQRDSQEPARHMVYRVLKRHHPCE